MRCVENQIVREFAGQTAASVVELAHHGHGEFINGYEDA